MSPGPSLLLVSDDTDTRATAANALRTVAAETVERDGVEAPLWLAAHAVDLVILDFRRQLVVERVLTQLADEGRAVPVVALVPAESAAWRAALASGATDCVGLPVNPTELALRAEQQLHSARLFRSLREETQQNSEALLQAERRLRTFQPYADFFRSSADGMLVMTPRGRLLFANPKAKSMAGIGSDLEGTNALDFLAPHEHDRARAVTSGFGRNEYPERLDFDVRSPKGERTLSVSFSRTGRSENAVLLTFRDVTHERRTERELKKTKEFLERVIESSVDAIVSADMKGRVMLFNGAAARIFGYQPDEVIHRMSVDRLYPKGGAREVMRKIRSPGYGGVDRLEQQDVLMLDSVGRQVPVKMSAAMIYDNGVAVGSVGIFTDIREQLRMQEHLRTAQAEIAEHERNMALAQLAGATAHELNQPLTGVITHAELLSKRLRDEPLQQAALVIVEQAERMANIVKQIGRLTRYETKAYVGGAQIIDLDRAASVESTELELDAASAQGPPDDPAPTEGEAR